jgi:hypothetical protein
MVTTTHDPRGGGRPRLIVALGDTAPQHADQREFDLVPGVTVIGSGPQADVRLEGLEAHHAEIRRDERDERRFKGSSQHRLVGPSIGTRRGPLLVSSSRGSCGGGC